MISQVHQQEPEQAISGLCQVLEVSRSWYYEQQRRPAASESDVKLRDAIECIILDFPGYGYRRVTHALKRWVKRGSIWELADERDKEHTKHARDAASS